MGPANLEDIRITARSNAPVGICILECGGVAHTHAAAIQRLGSKARFCFASRSAEKVRKALVKTRSKREEAEVAASS